MSGEPERICLRRTRAFVIAALCASASVARQADSRPSSTPAAKPQVVSLAEARAAFVAADVDRDNRLAAGELVAAGLSAEDVKLADRDHDGVLRSEEYLGGLPLALMRAGKRPSPELEAEAIRLRALGTPTPARIPQTPATPETRSPAPGTDGGSAARERLASALRGPVEAPRPSRERTAGFPEDGPAATRLRTTPTAAETEARLKAARDSLAERLQHEAAGPEPAAPTGDSVSARRRRAQDAERNDASPTAARLRAARQKLDERIRESNTSDDTPASGGAPDSPPTGAPRTGSHPATSGPERPRNSKPAEERGREGQEKQPDTGAPPRDASRDAAGGSGRPPQERPREKPPRAR